MDRIITGVQVTIRRHVKISFSVPDNGEGDTEILQAVEQEARRLIDASKRGMKLNTLDPDEDEE